jgi:predicted HTH domain antitoxin
MGSVQIPLDQDLIAVLEELHRPVKEAAHELIVLELHRQGDISSGKAAELLKMRRYEFIRHASERRIPYLQLTGEELRGEIEESQSL